MADQLKDFFNTSTIKRIASMLEGAWPSFPSSSFIREASRGLQPLELLDRARHIERAMASALPRPFPDAARIILRSLGPVLEDVDGVGMAPFIYLPHVIFVAERGLQHFEASMELQHALTQRFTAEFSIRAFIEHHPDDTMARLRTWARDPSKHVRRLVSEGTRPRLPWAPRLRAFQRDPSPVLPLLELLKDDPELYVRRSVANNLNDVAKDHPAVALDVCERWSPGASEARRALIRHALRTLIKQGEPRALALLGCTDGSTLEVTAETAPRRIAWEGQCTVSVRVRNPGKGTERAVVDLAVHYVKASGSTNRKVFKGRNVVLAPGESLDFQHTLSFQERTTRRHHPGRHAVEVLVNGRAVPAGAVDLRRGR